MSKVYNWFKNEETIVLELKHYMDGVRYYKIDTKGFKKVYNDTCLQNLTDMKKIIIFSLSVLFMSSWSFVSSLSSAQEMYNLN